VSEQTHIFLQLVAVFGVASFAVLMAQVIRLPSIVGFLLAGVFLGPHGLELVPDLDALHILNEIAIVFLMFTIGLEFSIGSIKQLRKAFFGLGTLQVSGTAAVIALVMVVFLQVKAGPAVVAGYMIALSSTAIIMKLLQGSNEMASPQGNATLGVLLFQDVVAIPMMLSLPLLAGGQISKLFNSQASLLSFLGELLAFVAVAAIGARFMVPRILKIVAESRSRELFFFVVLFICFGLSLLAGQVGFSMPLGAFVAGVMIAGSPFGRQASSEIIPLRDNFLGFFFISLGMLLDLKFFGLNIHGILALGFLLLLIKMVITYLAAIGVRYTEKVAILVALTLFQVGEFAFVIAQESLRLQVISHDQFQYFLSISLLSMIVSPIVYQVAPAFAERMTQASGSSGKRRKAVEARKSGLSGHAIIIGYGLAGRMAAAGLEAVGVNYCVVDLNFKVINSLKARGVNAVYGDASKDEILEAVHADKARLVIVAVAGRHMVPAIVAALDRHHCKGQVIVRSVFEREAGEILEIRPGIDVVVSELESAKVLAERALMTFGHDLDAARSILASIDRTE
jgi:CPA2 family monovalent cation:H+ antiporter-2